MFSKMISFFISFFKPKTISEVLKKNRQKRLLRNMALKTLVHLQALFQARPWDATKKKTKYSLHSIIFYLGSDMGFPHLEAPKVWLAPLYGRLIDKYYIYIYIYIYILHRYNIRAQSACLGIMYQFKAGGLNFSAGSEYADNQNRLNSII